MIQNGNTLTCSAMDGKKNGHSRTSVQMIEMLKYTLYQWPILATTNQIAIRNFKTRICVWNLVSINLFQNMHVCNRLPLSKFTLLSFIHAMCSHAHIHTIWLLVVSPLHDQSNCGGRFSSGGFHGSQIRVFCSEKIVENEVSQTRVSPLPDFFRNN